MIAPQSGAGGLRKWSESSEVVSQEPGGRVVNSAEPRGASAAKARTPPVRVPAALWSHGVTGRRHVDIPGPDSTCSDPATYQIGGYG
jgi:hypothetical protein